MNKSTFSLEFCVHFPIAGAEKPKTKTNPRQPQNCKTQENSQWQMQHLFLAQLMNSMCFVDDGEFAYMGVLHVPPVIWLSAGMRSPRARGRGAKCGTHHGQKPV